MLKGIIYTSDTMSPDLLKAYVHFDALVDKACQLMQADSESSRILQVAEIVGMKGRID